MSARDWFKNKSWLFYTCSNAPMYSACCRNLEEGETELKGNEKLLLDLICKAYYLPQWCSVNDYKAIFEAEGLQVRNFPDHHRCRVSHGSTEMAELVKQLDVQFLSEPLWRDKCSMQPSQHCCCMSNTNRLAALLRSGAADIRGVGKCLSSVAAPACQ